MELLFPTLIGLAIGIAGIWWLISEESKESEERYRNSREFNHERFNPEIARRQADVSELYRLHPDWPSERIYEKIAAKKKAEESDSSETL